MQSGCYCSVYGHFHVDCSVTTKQSLRYKVKHSVTEYSSACLSLAMHGQPLPKSLHPANISMATTVMNPMCDRLLHAVADCRQLSFHALAFA